MTKPHKHKDLIIVWANGGTIQWWSDGQQSWRDVHQSNLYQSNLYQPDFNCDAKFRVKPKTISINGIEVPAPEQQALDTGTIYYMPSLLNSTLFGCCSWDNDGEDKRTLSRGLVHLTKEAAEQHAKALLSFTSK